MLVQVAGSASSKRTALCCAVLRGAVLRRNTHLASSRFDIDGKLGRLWLSVTFAVTEPLESR